MESLLQIDYAVFDFINQNLSNTFFDTVMPFIRNKKTWIPFYLFLAYFILKKYSLKNAAFIIVLAVLCVALADGVSSHILKPYFHRLRPCNFEPFAQHINLVLKNCSGAFSFPSSHAANHFALGTFLALVFYKLYKWFSLLLIIWAGFICFAQIYVGVHFPSDIFGGSFLGIFIAFIAYFVYKKSSNNMELFLL